jgi:hypothetical protein
MRRMVALEYGPSFRFVDLLRVQTYYGHTVADSDALFGQTISH